MNIFQLGDFKLHSGQKSKWKIDCDALTDADYETFAWIVSNEFKIKFGKVKPIPRGGNRFAEALKKYESRSWDIHTLIVDDVLTTGKSFEAMRRKEVENILGVVIFARGKCPDWVIPIFQMRGAR